MTSSEHSGSPPGPEMVDVTALISECAASLTMENPFVCNGRAFNLHDAMAASHLTHPKMDCCEVPLQFVAPYSDQQESNEQTDRRVYPRPVPSSIDDDFMAAPWEDLTLTEACAIACHCLVRLQSMLGGASVAESTFTCLYAHSNVLQCMRESLFASDNELEDKFQQITLRNEVALHGSSAQLAVFATSLALVGTSQILRRAIINADIYEEEDFVANTHDIPFYTESADENMLETMVRVLELAVDELQTEPPSAERDTLILLLKFQHGFSAIVSFLAKLTAKSLGKAIYQMKVIANKTQECLIDAQEEIDAILSDPSAKAAVWNAFDSHIIRPLVGNAPVRSVKLEEPKVSLTILATIVGEIESMVFDVIINASSLSRVQRMLDKVAPCGANIITRSLLLLNLYFDEKLFGQHSLKNMIMEDFKLLTSVSDDYFSYPYSQTFVDQLTKPVYELLKLRLISQHRQRTYIELVSLPEWRELQEEANSVDSLYHDDPATKQSAIPIFGSYVLTTVIRLMEKHVSVGIELGLFYYHMELAYANWYRDFLLSALVNNLTSMRNTKTVEPPVEGKPVKGRGKKKAGKPKSNGHHHVTPEDKECEYEIVTLGLRRNLCRGTFRFMAALRQAGVLQHREDVFTNLGLVFEKRFKAFAQISQPPQLQFSQFMEGCDFAGISQSEILQATSEWYLSSRKIVEDLMRSKSVDALHSPMLDDELRSILKVCIGNSVYLLKLSQVEGSDTKVEFDFSSHRQFCTMKLVSS